ncbi:hypothetical protein ACFQ3C_17545 [Seohaeicola saemankumensis]|uniref:Uncharacterized protein n=1 Tax=Seohaeicola saemankumensis TaxID=481181 RepID=A0ABW3TII5_9RHOB
MKTLREITLATFAVALMSLAAPVMAEGDTGGDTPSAGANNGHGNGDQAAPGNSGGNNNAENSGNSGQGNSGNGQGGLQGAPNNN